MSEEMEHSEYEQGENQDLVNLRNQIIKALSDNCESKFILLVVQNMSDYATVAKMFQGKESILKVQKKSQLNNVLNFIKEYYEKLKSKGSVQKKNEQMIETFRTIIQRNMDGFIDQFNFNQNYFENIIQSGNKLQQNGKQLKQKLLDEEQLQRQWVKSAKNQQLQTILLQLIQCFCDSSDVDYIVKQIMKKKSFEIFYSSEGRGMIRQANIKRLIGAIKQLDCFKMFIQNGQNNINELRDNFLIEFAKKYYSKLSINQFKELSEQLIKNPSYYFTDRDDLNNKQKQILINQLWLNQHSSINKLIEAYSNKDKLDNKVQKQIISIIEYMVNVCKFNLSIDQIQEIKIDLLQSNLIHLFDQVDNIKNNIKNVYQFISKNCPNYLKKYQKKPCLVKQKIQIKSKLKKELFGLISYQNWSKLEQSILKGDLTEIDHLVKDRQKAYNLKLWIYDNISEQYITQQTMKDSLRQRVQLQLIKYFISKNIRSLSFENILNLTYRLLDNPCLEVVQAQTNLTPNNISTIRSDIMKQPQFQNYIIYKQIDLDYLRQKARRKMEQAITKLNFENNYKIEVSVKTELANSFLQKPKNSVIYENKDVGQKYKLQFLQKVNQIVEVKKYISGYDLIQSVKKQQDYIKYLSTIFPIPAELQIVKQYISTHGQILFNKQNRPVVNTDNRDLQNIIKNLKTQPSQKLKDSQQTKQFKQFLQDLPIIVDFNKKESQAKFLEIAKKIICSQVNDEQSSNPIYQEIKTDLIINGAKQLTKNAEQKSSMVMKILEEISRQRRYQSLVYLQENIFKNQKLFNLLKLKKQIKSLYNQASLMSLSSEEKTEIIAKIAQNCNVQTIRNHSKLSPQAVNNIINFIKESESYKTYFSDKKIVQKPKSKPISNNNQIIKDTQIKQEIKPEIKPSTLTNPEEKRQFIPLKEQKMIQNLPIVNQSQPQTFHEPIDESEILKKWQCKLFQFKAKSQYKNARILYQKEPLVLVRQIMKNYRLNDKKWSEQMPFWKDGTKFQRNNLIKELNEFSNMNPQFKTDMEKIII